MINKKVDTFFVGPRKSATTWIYDFLMSRIPYKLSKSKKEIFYFDKFNQKSLLWYENHFTNKQSIDFAPGYFGNEDVIRRIHDYNPNAKIIITLREPVKRYCSDFNHHVKHGHISELSSLENSFKTVSSLYSQSQYIKYVSCWKKTFSDNQVKVVYFEDFVTNKMAFIDDLLCFLNLELEYDHKLLEKKPVNKASYSRFPMLSKKLNHLTLFFKRCGLDSILNIMKRIGIKKILYSERKSPLVYEEEDLLTIKVNLNNEANTYEKRNY
ncbi:sulfotransferase family protein [Vibrio coralliirubri]|uniref:sulfotransferase family protein n=1 Tax=Vibrio coralliirubri TaxID=1516159 RepID=UPI00069B57B7|nr:sulfotransferase [Vibrio coralliirubri]